MSYKENGPSGFSTPSSMYLMCLIMSMTLSDNKLIYGDLLCTPISQNHVHVGYHVLPPSPSNKRSLEAADNQGDETNRSQKMVLAFKKIEMKSKI